MAAAPVAQGLRGLARSWQGLRERAVFPAPQKVFSLPGSQAEGLVPSAKSFQAGVRQVWSRQVVSEQAIQGQVASQQTVSIYRAFFPTGRHVAEAQGQVLANGIAPPGVGLRTLLGGAVGGLKVGSSGIAPVRIRGSGLLQNAGGRCGALGLQANGSGQSALRGLNRFHSAAPTLPFAISQLAKVHQIAAKHVIGRPSHLAGPSSGRRYSSASWSDRVQQQLSQGLQWVRGSAKPQAPKAAAAPSLKLPKQAGAALRAASSKSGVDRLMKAPAATARRLAVQYRQAAALQLEAFWRRNYPIVLGLIAFLLVMLLWRLMYGVASTFISFSEGMAKYGFLALASATVAFLGLYLRARYTITPDVAYRKAIRMLQVNSQVLEVMGAPLTGSEVRAYVMSGGGLRVKHWSLRLASARCFLIFPVRGAERRGLVSADLKKKHGKYVFKLLAVDVPTAAEDQRLYVLGDEAAYVESGGVIAELRDPLVRALAKQKDFEAEDDREAAEEARVEREEYEQKVAGREREAQRQAEEERKKKVLAEKSS